MKKIVVSFCFIVAIGIVNIQVYAAPIVSSISGTILDGQVLTISGSDFGAKSPAAPLVWDTFENGTNGSLIQNVNATVGRWDSGGGSENVYYTNSISYAGGKAARHPFSSDWNSSLAKNGTYPVLYIDFKRFYPSSNGYPSNYKPWRVYGNNDAMQLYMGFGCGYQVSDLYTDSGGGTNWSAESLNGKMDAWQHYQIIYKESSIGVANGTFINYLNGKVDGWNSTAVETRGSNTHLEQIRIGHYFDVGARDGCDPNDNSVVYTDNVYIDTTWARVEIGNASTYAASTHREILKPTQWDSSQITVSTNIGTFVQGQTAYLFVIDSNNVASSGYPINIGQDYESDTPPPPIDNLPTIAISSPTSDSSYTSDLNSIDISGSTIDDYGVVNVTWSNNRGGSGTALNTSGNWSSFTLENVSLQEGSNIITVTATDTEGQTATDSLSITFNAPDPDDTEIPVWNSAINIGDNTWSDSSVTYCVRLLIPGSQIGSSGNTIKLGFQGRNSGSYTFKSVSIAERDTSSGQGNVVDSTWTKITFDKKGPFYGPPLQNDSWENYIVTVPQGTEKISNAIKFNIQSGTDYYVTFKVQSPSVYLDPPSGYEELIFTNSDNTSVLDWSGTGYTVTQDYHALSNIYVTSELAAPGPVVGP